MLQPNRRKYFAGGTVQHESGLPTAQRIVRNKCWSEWSGGGRGGAPSTSISAVAGGSFSREEAERVRRNWFVNMALQGVDIGLVEVGGVVRLSFQRGLCSALQSLCVGVHGSSHNLGDGPHCSFVEHVGCH